jgi:hypothetical protein
MTLHETDNLFILEGMRGPQVVIFSEAMFTDTSFVTCDPKFHQGQNFRCDFHLREIFMMKISSLSLIYPTKFQPMGGQEIFV